MKAYHVLLFMYILNLVIILIQELGFYQLGYESSLGPWGTKAYLIATLIGGIVGAVGVVTVLRNLNPFNRSSSDLQIAGITFFGVTFWGFYLTMVNGISTIIYTADVDLSNATTSILAILTLILIIIFAVGLNQLLTGGWKSYE